MSKTFWLGIAGAVAQISDASIDSVDATPANNTFTVTIGGVAISQAGTTDANTTATNLVALLNASTHPYFAAITWSAPGSGVIRGTADTAGVPFTAALTVSGAGSGSVTDFSDTTSSAGPNDFGTADNWSGGAVPSSGDDVVFENNSVPCCWGLDQNAVTLASLTIKASYTGKIGLDRSVFAQSSDGSTTTTSSAVEYRETYLKIGATEIDIGAHYGPGTASGSGRIKINNVKAGSSTTTVHATAQAASESGLPAVRLLANNSGADFYVRAAAGGVGIAVDDPTETATVGAISISDPTSAARVFAGPGVTLTSWKQTGGTNVLQAAATISSVTVDGGVLSMEGDYTVTALTVNGGTVYDNHVKSSGSAVTTATINGGTLDTTRSSEARTYGTLNPDGGTFKADADVLTVTTFDQPAGIYSISVS